MTHYIIISILTLLVIRIAYVNWRLNEIIVKLNKERTEAYSQYIDAYYEYCQRVISNRQIATGFCNILTDTISKIVDTKQQQILQDFIDSLERNNLRDAKYEKEMEEFMVKYEIEKFVGKSE